MSPVCSQPSASSASAVLLGQVAVAGHHDAAAHEQLAVLGELQLDAGRRRADRPDLDPVGRVARARAAGLGHAPQLRQRDADGVEELDDLDGRRRGADVDRLDLVEAEHRAQPGEDLLVGRATAAASSSGTGSPACSRRTLRIAASSAACTGARSSSGRAASIVSSPALSFSQIRGTAKNQLGRTSGR